MASLNHKFQVSNVARTFVRRTSEEFWVAISNHCDHCADKKLDRKTDNTPVATDDETAEYIIDYWGA